RVEHEDDTAVLHLSQQVPATPGQPDKKPVPIPLRIALFDRLDGQHKGEELIVLDKAQASFSFAGFAMPPVLSVNRGFTAPVAIDQHVTADDLVFLAAHDDDPFARYEAMQELVVTHLKDAVAGSLSAEAREQGRTAIAGALGAILA